MKVFKNSIVLLVLAYGLLFNDLYFLSWLCLSLTYLYLLSSVNIRWSYFTFDCLIVFMAQIMISSYFKIDCLFNNYLVFEIISSLCYAALIQKSYKLKIQPLKDINVILFVFYLILLVIAIGFPTYLLLNISKAQIIILTSLILLFPIIITSYAIIIKMFFKKQAL